jgi:ATP-dependent 26S proteasome regulatory subunit
LQQQLAGLSINSGSSGSSGSAIAGLDAPLELLRQLVGWPRQYAAAAAQLGVEWPRGVLLHGPPGCGKTLLVKTVAGGARVGLRPLPGAAAGRHRTAVCQLLLR